MIRTKRSGMIAWAIISLAAWQPAPRASASSDNIPLRVATMDHPHIRAIQDGRVPVFGCTVEYSTHSLDDLMGDLSGDRRFDVVEVELLPVLQKKSAGALADYSIIPVFLTRAFQLRHIYVRSGGPIRGPADLRGKKVGIDGNSWTAPAWVRGSFQRHWSLKPEEIHWVDIRASTGSAKSLSQLLLQGDVDAIISDVSAEPGGAKDQGIVRLFPDYKSAEQEVFTETRVFPVVTALAVKTDLVKNNAWLPEALFQAFSKAKEDAYRDGTMPLPWDDSNVEEVHKIMGDNYWSYGVKSNPKTLGALFRNAESWGLLKEPMTAADLFKSSTQLLMEP